MENQHRQIAGYRELTQTEISLMNEIKLKAEEVGQLVEKIKAYPDVDGRWAAEGKTDLQKGFMSLTRSIAKPTTF